MFYASVIGVFSELRGSIILCNLASFKRTHTLPSRNGKEIFVMINILLIIKKMSFNNLLEKRTKVIYIYMQYILIKKQFL